jgi:hypothetical protein
MVKEPKETQQAENENLEEVESPNFVRFVNIGDSVEGVYKDYQRSVQYGFGMYSLEQADGTMKRVHGSSDLDDKMISVPMGTWVRIAFTEEKHRPKGIMKIFSVKVRMK